MRIYGQLTIFSLLQVVVAALLNDSLEFGVLLLVYMIVAVAGVALFFVYPRGGANGGRDAESPRGFSGGRWRRNAVRRLSRGIACRRWKWSIPARRCWPAYSRAA